MPIRTQEMTRKARAGESVAIRIAKTTRQTQYMPPAAWKEDKGPVSKEAKDQALSKPDLIMATGAYIQAHENKRARTHTRNGHWEVRPRGMTFKYLGLELDRVRILPVAFLSVRYNIWSELAIPVDAINQPPMLNIRVVLCLQGNTKLRFCGFVSACLCVPAAVFVCVCACALSRRRTGQTGRSAQW